MAIAKVTLNGVTQMDVTGKTVTAASMLNGVTALKNDGTDITGNIASKSSSDLTVSGATVTAPAGNYESAASKSVAAGSVTVPSSISSTSDAGIEITTDATHNKFTMSATQTNQMPVVTTPGYVSTGTPGNVTISLTKTIPINSSSDLTASGATVTAPAGYYGSVATKSVAAGSATTPATTVTANPSISVSSGGLITATASATESVTPTVSAGYVSSGTAGTITVSGSNTSQLSTQAAQTIHPSSTDQTITSGIYLTGAQTIQAVKITGLSAENILEGVTVEIGDADDSDRILSVTGTMPNPTTVSLYTTVSDVFNNPHVQVESYSAVELTKNNKACTLFLNMNPTKWATMGSGAALGTLKDDFIPAGKSGTVAYVIVPLMGSSSPYSPCGSIWIYTQGVNRGKVICYFDSNASPGYFYASYIAGALI